MHINVQKPPSIELLHVCILLMEYVNKRFSLDSRSDRLQQKQIQPVNYKFILVVMFVINQVGMEIPLSTDIRDSLYKQWQNRVGRKSK